MSVIFVHQHICDDCIGAWEHADETCYRNYRKVLTCGTCMTAALQKGVWMEMARNMPIPHDHTCVICECEWEHNDRQCALEERYWLECETCMTFACTHSCPKCGTESEEIQYTSQEVRCVCPRCRHYFAPQGQKEIYAIKEISRGHVCPSCGTHNENNGNLCAECGHRFRSYDSREQSAGSEEDEMDDYGPGFG